MSRRPPLRVRPRHAVAWIVLGWAMSLGALFAAPLVKASQARAFAVARTMATTGDFVVPRYNGEVRLKKPPLASWAQAGAMGALGTTDRRVAGAVSWLLGLLFALGPLLLGAALARPFAGFLGSLLLVTCRSAVVWGASAEHDVPFAGLIALSLALLARALAPGGRTRTAAAAGLACGAAVLVKGPFALAFVLGTALVAGGARRAREGEVSRARLWGALVLGALLPAAAWLAALLVRLGGVGPVFDEMKRQALGEAGAHLKSGLANALYYVGMIPKWAMPWPVALLPMLAVRAWRRRRGDPAVAPLPPFALRSFLATFVVLTVVPAKQEHYLLPALPAAFLLGACALEDALRERTRAARLVAPLLAALALGFVFERVLGARASLPDALVLTAIAGQAAVSVAAVLFFRRREAPARLVPLVLVAAFGTTLVATVADAERLRATDDLGRAVARFGARVPAHAPVLGFATGVREAFDTTAAYLDRVVERVATVDALAARLPSVRGATLLVEAPEDALLAPVRASLDRVGELAPARGADKDRIHVYRVR